MIEKMIQLYIERYNNMDIDGMLELLSDQLVFENISNTSGILQVKGKPEFEKIARASSYMFSSREQRIRSLIAGSHRAAVELDCTVTAAKELPSWLKAGEKIKLRGVSIFEFKANLISRISDYS